jgi:hypothetical protein
MRIISSQFTIRQMMSIVFITAVLLGGWVESGVLWRRWKFCQEMADMYARREQFNRLMIAERRANGCFRIMPPGSARPEEIELYLKCAKIYARLSATYREAAVRPWIPLPASLGDSNESLKVRF